MADRPARTWGSAEQKIVGARQKWCCAHCGCCLPPSFEVDHIVPLWAGGVDCWKTNAQALCPTCHASKTQRESIQRRDERRARREAAIRRAQSQHPPAPPLAPPAPPAPPAPLTDEQIDLDFLSENPFLQFSYIAKAERGVKRVRHWLS